MKAIFVDTSFYAAVFNPRDMWHAKAREAASQVTAPLLTSEFVLLEIANFCATGSKRAIFVSLVERLANDPNVAIGPASDADFQQGLQLFRARHDKQWSLTDCISFEIMKQRGLVEALTADEHFEQAGYRALMRH